MNSYFKNITDKLDVLENSKQEPLNELFGGLPSTLSRRFMNFMQRSSIGAGKRELEKKANVLNQKWLEWRGQTDAVPNKANIESWIKDKLGMRNQEVWNWAIDEFSEKYPEAATKYIKNERLDKYEVVNFFQKLIQVRLAHIDMGLEAEPKEPIKPQTKPEHDAPWWNKKQANFKNQPGLDGAQASKSAANDAISALVNLGYNRKQAAKAVNIAMSKNAGTDVQELIRQSLAALGATKKQA